MDEEGRARLLKRRLGEFRLYFIGREIEYASLIVRAAATTYDRETAERNLRDAQLTHHAAIQFLIHDSLMTPDQRADLRTALADLARQIDGVRTLIDREESSS